MHRRLHMVTRRTRRHIDFSVQCIQRENVPVLFPRWRTRAAIPYLAKIRLPLPPPMGQLALLRNTNRQSVDVRRQVIHNPVRERSARRIRICYGKRQALGARRRRSPRQRRRLIFSIARELLRNRAVLKALAGQRQIRA